MKKFLLWMILLASVNLFAQNQYYVSTSGSDSNDGSQAHPYRHISKAIASFTLGSAGAVINVHAGTYSDESIPCAGGNASVCFNRGGSSPTVRLKLVCDTQWSVPSGSGCLIRGNNEFLVSGSSNNWDIGAPGGFGFDFSNPNLSTAILTAVCNIFSGPGNCSTGNSVHILGNYIHEMSSSITACEVNPNGHPAIDIQNRHGPYVTDAQIIGNRITDIGPQNLSRLNGGPGCFDYYGIYLETQQGIFEDNVETNIAGYGVHYYSAPCQGVISNNTISRTEFPNIIAGGGDCNNGIAQGSVSINNNILGQTAPGQSHIVTGVPGGSGIGSSSNPVLASNNVFGNLDGNTHVQCISPCFTTESNSQTEAPTTTFQSYTGGNNDDFHLKSGSVAIGGGTTTCVQGGQTPCTPSVDFEGKPIGSPPSVGAYASGTAPPATTATLSPSTFDFGNQIVGVQSGSQPFTLNVSSSGSISITSIVTSLSTTFIKVSSTCGTSIAASGNCVTQVACKPPTVGTFNGTLTVTDSASNSPQVSNLACAGVGIPSAPTGLTVVVQ